MRCDELLKTIEMLEYVSSLASYILANWQLVPFISASVYYYIYLKLASGPKKSQ